MDRTMPGMRSPVGDGWSEARIPPSGNRRKKPLPWRFPCILVAASEGQLHTLNFIYTALRVDWLMYRAPSAKKVPFRFFLLPASEVP